MISCNQIVIALGWIIALGGPWAKISAQNPNAFFSPDDFLEYRLIAGVGIVRSWPMNNDVGDTDRFICPHQFGELCGRAKTSIES